MTSRNSVADPYAPPATTSESSPKRPKPSCLPPAVGCGFGGCLLPTAGFLFCALILNDIGGPLFWPIIAGFSGFCGAFVGMIYSLIFRKKA